MRYSFKHGLIKAVKYVVIFILPVLIDRFIVSYPEIAQLSVAGILVLSLNYLKVKVGVKL